MEKINIREFRLQYGEHKNLACTVPCTLYSVLQEHGIIEDPFYRDNEKKYIDIAREDCEFTASFDLSERMLAQERVELRFCGIDTLADVWLNGTKLGSTDNMHHGWNFPVKGIARKKGNELRVHFYSPVVYTERENQKFELYSPDCSLPGYAHMRKTYCSFGWDWGPVIPDMGFYREVYVAGESGARLADVWVRQLHRGGAVALCIENRTDFCAGDEKIEYELFDPNGKKIAAAEAACNGQAQVTVEHAQLWWPNGYGGQPLYTLRCKLMRGGAECGGKELRIGLRTLTVSTQRDRWGNEFCFVINGKKIFSMGANYIPPDALLGRVTEQRTRALLKDCIAANYNTVRVWGGGYYPDDYFYDICDELGLIVWQDFMFACSTIYLNARIEKSCRREFTEFISRIRSHACIGLLCGNNEVEMAWVSWNLPNNLRKKEDYIRLFERILPDLCEEMCPDIFYWPSSPSSVGGFVSPDDENRGDAHCWSVWHGGEPFEKYREKYIRFCSEYGYEAFPSVKTLRTVATEEDMNAFSPVMDAHQKGAGGNTRIVAKTADYFKYVSTFEEFIYVSQLMQAEAIRYGAEHFRRNRGRCMGSLYWQLNDNWQTASWSSVDYCGRWKALHYFARRFYAPVLLSVCDVGPVCTFNLSNERMSAFEGTVEWELMRGDFTAVRSGSVPVSVGALAAKDLFVADLSEELRGHEREYVLAYRLKEGDAVLSEDCVLFCKPKYFAFERAPQVNVEIGEYDAEHFVIGVSAACFVKNLEIDFKEADCRLSDNFFSLLSAGTKRVLCEKNGHTAEELRRQLVLRCVNGVC